MKSKHSFGGLDTPLETRLTWNADISYELDGKPYISRGEDLAGCVFYLLSPTEFTILGFTNLLLPSDLGGLRFSDMTDSRYIGSEKVDGFDCFLLESSHWNCTMWIDKRTFALRKTVDWAPTPTVCILHPQFDGFIQ